MALTAEQIKEISIKAVDQLNKFFRPVDDQEMLDEKSPSDTAETVIAAAIWEALALAEGAVYGAARPDDGIPVLDPNWKWAYIFKGMKCVSASKPKADGAAGFYASGCEYLQDVELLPDLGSPKESLHQIINGRLVKCQWIPENDERVMVRDCEGMRWLPRYSAGRVGNGYIICHPNGQSSWTSDKPGTTRWAFWRKPTEEELKP